MEFTIGIAGILLIISVVFLLKSKKEKRYLNDNDVIEGTIVEYQRIWKKLYPIITYVDNGEKITVRQSGVTNMRIIKEGSHVRIVNIGNGKILTDYNVKLSMYYAIVFFISSALIFVASFMV